MYDKYSEVIGKFEKAYNLPARPTQHHYHENYIFDEEQSVKWNREEVIRRNEELHKEKETLQTERYKAIRDAELDIIKYLCELYPTIDEKIVKKLYNKIYDESFRDRFDYNIQYVIDECEEFLSIFSEEE